MSALVIFAVIVVMLLCVICPVAMFALDLMFEPRLTDRA